MLKLKDYIYLKDFNISEDDVNAQIKTLEKNNSFINICDAANTENGIIVIDNPSNYIDIFNKQSVNFEIFKFVPASGAATRMFKRLAAFFSNPENYDIEDGGFYSVKNTFENIEKFAFFNKLRNSCEINNHNKLSNNILYNCLNYANTPKGLIDFHKYKNDIRTSFEEHVHEAYTISSDMGIHLTVSEEYLQGFKTEVNKVAAKLNMDELNVSFSFQDKSTDTVAIYEDGNIVRNEDGSILLRPGGHGALINNLNNIDSDIVFIKNIDNVVHASLLDEIVNYKKMLGGLLIEIIQNIRNLYGQLENNEKSAIKNTTDYLKKTFGIDINLQGTDIEKYSLLKDYISKPIRVCGMVKNTGEPGGGPFWVKNKNGSKSLQIVEKAQIDLSDSQTAKIFNESTHFNPVDIVCYLKNPAGEKLNLKNFIDSEASFVSEKTYNGKPIRVLEHPGLWNGAMADWLTVFVEVPLITFNPVKEINDLLRDEHLGNL